MIHLSEVPNGQQLLAENDNQFGQQSIEMWGIELTLNKCYEQVIESIDGIKSIKNGSGSI
jgi:hypothetical protein